MADQTHADIVIDAPPAEVMDVIADLAKYPEWSDGVKSAEVLKTGADGRPSDARLRVEAGPIRDTYELAYEWNGDESVTWQLTKSGVLKSQDGTYTLEDNGDGTTTVIYDLTIELNVPMIGMLKKRAEKSVVETALNGLKKRVENG